MTPVSWFFMIMTFILVIGMGGFLLYYHHHNPDRHPKDSK